MFGSDPLFNDFFGSRRRKTGKNRSKSMIPTMGDFGVNYFINY